MADAKLRFSYTRLLPLTTANAHSYGGLASSIPQIIETIPNHYVASIIYTSTPPFIDCLLCMHDVHGGPGGTLAEFPRRLTVWDGIGTVRDYCTETTDYRDYCTIDSRDYVVSIIYGTVWKTR